MRREDGSSLQKTVFRSSVRAAAIFKGFSGEFEEFLELVGLQSGKEGRCFHHTRGSVALHQKVLCFALKVIRPMLRELALRVSTCVRLVTRPK